MPRVTRPTDETPEVKPIETPPEAKVTRIIRELEMVMIEAPLCSNPPGVEHLHGSRAAHINVHLYPSLTRNGRLLLHRLYHALLASEAKLENGRPVGSRQHAVVWLIEQLGQEA
jgi:hypothetical protein